MRDMVPFPIAGHILVMSVSMSLSMFESFKQGEALAPRAHTVHMALLGCCKLR